MVYVALLRGINVGGGNKVAMTKLKQVFEELGFGAVTTYINSGNVVFTSSKTSNSQIAVTIEAAIEKHFRLPIKVVVRNQHQIEAVCSALPAHWVNDATMKCDVMFLWEEVDAPESLAEVGLKKELADVVYVPGAIIWRIDRDKVTRGGVDKLIKSRLYKLMTIRNCNTVRKIQLLMQQATP